MNNLVYGLNSVTSSLSRTPCDITQVVISEEKRGDKINKILQLAKKNNCQISYLSSKEFDKKFAKSNHQGVAAYLTKETVYHERDLKVMLEEAKKPLLILILDGVTDPHNLGACLRSADAAGVHMVLAPKDRNVGMTPVVRKVASGAAETVPFIQVTNLARTLELLKDSGVWVYGAAGEAESLLYDIDFTGSVAVVMGAEGDGLRRLTRETCDGLFSIPMCGEVDSLNVSVATGVALFEVIRQRRTKSGA